MADAAFGEYRKKVFQYYEEKRFADALAVARDASARFPEHDAKTSFWIACMQGRLGDFEGALRTLQSATRRGLWWPPGTLEDSDLDTIRTRPSFKIIEEDCRRNQQQAPKVAKPELMVRVPSSLPNNRTLPTLVVFHARYGEPPEISAEEWLPLSTRMIVAAPWSSQVYASDGRCWDDMDLAEKDVKWTFEELRTKQYLNPEKLILSGFSQGAALSIYSALKRLVPCKGFVAVAPSDWVRPEQKPAIQRTEISRPFANFVEESDCRGLRGVIIIGNKDPFYPKIQKLYTLMVERGLNGKFLDVPDLGHEYPEGFEGILQESVDFVLNINSKARP